MKTEDPRMERPEELDRLFEQIQTKADKMWGELEIVSQNDKVRALIAILYCTMIQIKAHPGDEKLIFHKDLAEEQIEVLLSEPQEKKIIIPNK